MIESAALPARLPAPALVVLPEIFNANPHIRSVADGWAAERWEEFAKAGNLVTADGKAHYSLAGN